MASHREHQGSISSSVPPTLPPCSPAPELLFSSSRAFENYVRVRDSCMLFRGLFFLRVTGHE